MNDERRIELFQDIAVLFQHQPEELFRIVRDEIYFQTFIHARDFNRLASLVKSRHSANWKNVYAAQVIVGIGGRKAIQVRAADGCEQQWVWLGGNLFVNSWIELHIVSGSHAYGLRMHTTDVGRALPAALSVGGQCPPYTIVARD